MKIDPQFLAQTPIEEHTIAGRPVTVYRADLVPQPPLPSYVKMIELYPFLKLLAERGYKAVGYYAVPESEWVRAIPDLADSLGLQTIIGLSKTKTLPPYATALSNYLHFLSPNIYAVNWARTKKYVESQGGFMVPMGLECEEVIEKFTHFLDGSPIPDCQHIIVPTGSGVCLSGILRHLKGRGKVYGICTRPTASVAKVLSRYVFGGGTNVELHPRSETATISDALVQAPFPMHRFWEGGAFQWLLDNQASLDGSICFLNLGS